ncbi:hypothetical protein [Asaia bogorensis]|uniref:hypothetical protein n=1 Tax=Asaia bogorensis TaxID=91915 RepID=UPI00286793B7|nr:hypothetical protein [Asaia bogorensis]MDR6182251.1 hypothetical protein [Asaia bogorensis NBRC 16594]
MTKGKNDPLVPLWIVVLGLVSLVLDNHPHFMMGDSMSYLSTWPGEWMPPDRSWPFGLLVHGIVLFTHSLDAFVIIQVLLQCLLANFIANIFRIEGSIKYLFVSIFIFDPMLATYARFYMSDFTAALCFVAWVCLVSQVLNDYEEKAGFRALAGIAALGMSAVFIRVAYVPIECLTIAIFVAVSVLRRSRKIALRALLIIPIPVFAAFFMIIANGLVFDGKLESPFFLNRFSGMFTAGVFAPAISAEDIRAAGVPVTDDEVEKMRLGDYHLRLAQVWGEQPYWLNGIVKKYCHVTDVYDARLDKTMGKIVHHAFLRNPYDFAGIWLRTLVYYFRPGEWRRDYDVELGLQSTFPQDFVKKLNKALPFDPITQDTPERLSRVTWVSRNVVSIYPLLLTLIFFISLGSMVFSRKSMIIFPACGIVSSIVLVPLYSNYVIPRYVLSSILLGYILLFIIASAIWKKYQLSHKSKAVI